MVLDSEKDMVFFDLEWGMFADIKVVDESTPIVAVVHDVQVVDFDLEPSNTDIIVDWIVTNKKKLSTKRNKSRPSGIYWDLLEKGMLEATPPLRELKNNIKVKIKYQLYDNTINKLLSLSKELLNLPYLRII